MTLWTACPNTTNELFRPHTASLISAFFLSVSACTAVSADWLLGYSLHAAWTLNMCVFCVCGGGGGGGRSTPEPANAEEC